MKALIGKTAPYGEHVWTVWSEAPGISCYWLMRQEEGRAVFVKVRNVKGEWREVVEGGSD